MAAGIDNSFAVTSRGGTSYAWSFGANYRTGLGTDESVETPTLVGEGKIITVAECGGQFSVLAGPGEVAGEKPIMSAYDKVMAGPAGIQKYGLLDASYRFGRLRV